MKCSIFIATSLDGYIAKPDGNLDWLHEFSSKAPASEDFGYQDFISTVDAIVMGRHTFEKVINFENWPYGSMPVIVLSRTLRSIPSEAPSTVSFSNESPAMLLNFLEIKKFSHIYIDGGLTIQSFLSLNLVNELTISLIPTLLGEGIPLFGRLTQPVNLYLLQSRVYDCGIVQNKYQVNPI